MYKYTDLAKVNSELKTTDIKGKEYAAVAERIRAFRKLCPDGQIVTEFIRLDDGLAVCRAAVSIYDEEGRQKVIGTGTAYEKEGSSNINRTSYIENCETSAVGRALGMAGFGLLGDVATADEVNRAQEQLDRLERTDMVDSPIDERHFNALKKRFNAAGIRLSDVLAAYGIERPTQITYGLERIINSDFESLVKEIKGGASNG